MNEHLKLLGLKARDKVTGFSGVVTSISFDLYGCVQAILTPPATEEEEHKSARWLDVKRLLILDDTPVMSPPTFAPATVVPGPEDKPDRFSMPVQK